MFFFQIFLSFVIASTFPSTVPSQTPLHLNLPPHHFPFLIHVAVFSSRSSIRNFILPLHQGSPSFHCRGVVSLFWGFPSNTLYIVCFYCEIHPFLLQLQQIVMLGMVIWVSICILSELKILVQTFWLLKSQLKSLFESVFFW